MTLFYEFGGDDNTPGNTFEFEVDFDQRVEAIADYMADNYIHHVIQKHKPSTEQVSKLRHSKKVLADAFYYTLKDFDLVSDDMEDDMREIITDYFQDEAHQQYIENKYDYLEEF